MLHTMSVSESDFQRSTVAPSVSNSIGDGQGRIRAQHSTREGDEIELQNKAIAD